MDDLSQFNNLFFESANGHVQTIIELLEKSKTEQNKSLLSDLHLHLHSLKGEVLAMQYTQFGAFVTIMEKYVKNITESDSSITEKNRELMREAMDEIDDILVAIKLENKEPEGISDKSDVLLTYLGVTK